MSDWIETTLGECFDLVKTKSNPAALNPGDPYVGMEHILPDTPRVTTPGRAGDVTSQVGIFEPGDVLFGRLRAYLRKVALADFAGAASTEVLILRPRSRVLPAFLHLLASSPACLEAAVATSAGSRMPRTSAADLAAFPVDLPPIPEQRRIVDLVASLDTQVDALTQEVARADRVWWSLGAEMVASLTETETVRLDVIAEISGGLTKNKKDFDRPDLVEVPYLRVANVHRRYLDLRSVATIQTTAVKAEALRLLPGDVLFNEGGDRDKLGRGDVWKGQVEGCIHQNHVFRARVTDRAFDPRFVSAWGNTFGKAWFEMFGTQTTGIASINRGTLSRFPVPKVERDVQSRWADLLDAAVAIHDADQSELTRLRMFRSVLLTSLLNQDVEIPDSYDALLEDAS